MRGSTRVNVKMSDNKVLELLYRCPMSASVTCCLLTQTKQFRRKPTTFSRPPDRTQCTCMCHLKKIIQKFARSNFRFPMVSVFILQAYMSISFTKHVSFPEAVRGLRKSQASPNHMGWGWCRLLPDACRIQLFGRRGYLTILTIKTSSGLHTSLRRSSV